MNKPEPVKTAQGLRPSRKPAQGDKGDDSRAVLVDERWRAWVFYEQDTGVCQKPGNKTIPFRVPS